MSEHITSRLTRERDKAETRVGYLEECLRHVLHLNSMSSDRLARNVVANAITAALETGDPLTCPEARAAMKTERLT